MVKNVAAKGYVSRKFVDCVNPYMKLEYNFFYGNNTCKYIRFFKDNIRQYAE